MKGTAGHLDGAWRVFDAGDVNEDGVHDLAIGAALHTVAGLDDAGSVYLFSGLGW